MMILPSLSTAKQEGLSIIKSLPRGIIDLKNKIVSSFDKMCRQGLPQSRINISFTVMRIDCGNLHGRDKILWSESSLLRI